MNESAEKLEKSCNLWENGVVSSKQNYWIFCLLLLLMSLLLAILINCLPLLFRQVSCHDCLLVLILPSMNTLIIKSALIAQIFSSIFNFVWC